MELEKMIAWLKTCPYLKGMTLQTDRTGHKSGSLGLYGKGLKVLSKKEDISGLVTVRYRCSFVLYRVAEDREDRLEDARWMMQVQSWVAQQSLMGNAPVFGDLPGNEQVWAQQGSLKEPAKGGTVKYAVTITAEFEKIYEHI